MTDVLTLDEAEDLAARTLAAIDLYVRDSDTEHFLDADRERVASDLTGLRDHQPHPDGCTTCHEWKLDMDDAPLRYPCADVRRYSAGLVRTAALYGCEEKR